MPEFENRDRRKSYEENSRRSEVAGYVLLAGLAVELLFAFVLKKPLTEKLSTIIADLLIVGGVWGEIHFARKARLAGDDILAVAEARIAEANERAAKADLARVELEAQIAPRSLTKEQFDILQELRGKVSAINIASEDDAGTHWFAMLLVVALGKAGISVRIFRSDSHGAGNILFDRHAFNNPNGEPTNGEPIKSVFERAGIPITGVMSVAPPIIGAPPDIPLVMIGGRFVVPPKPPYLGSRTTDEPSTIK